MLVNDIKEAINDLLYDPYVLDHELKNFSAMSLIAVVETTITFVTKSSPALVGQPVGLFIIHFLFVACFISLLGWLVEVEWGTRLGLIIAYLGLIAMSTSLPAQLVQSDPSLFHYLLPIAALGSIRYTASALYLVVYFIGGLVSWYHERKDNQKDWQAELEKELKKLGIED
jgi:hypothetical protein